MREGKKTDGGAFKPPPPPTPDRIGLMYNLGNYVSTNISD